LSFSNAWTKLTFSSTTGVARCALAINSVANMIHFPHNGFMQPIQVLLNKVVARFSCKLSDLSIDWDYLIDGYLH